MKIPNKINALWGIWYPHGTIEETGCWLQHANGPEDGPEVYESRMDAETAAAYYSDAYPGCFAHPITDAAAEHDAALAAAPVREWEGKK